MKKLLLVLIAAVGSTLTLAGQDLYDAKRLVEIKIYFKQANWAKVLDSLKTAKEETRLTADVVVNGLKFPGAGIRYKGNSSFNSVRKKGLPKLPLNIKLNQTTKTLSLPGGYTTLKLANGFRDPSMVREVLAYEIARRYVPASKANFAKVFINDKYLGLYTNVESVDGPLLDRFFGSHDGPIIKGDPDWQATKRPGCLEGEKSSLVYQGADTTCYKGYYEADRPMDWLALVKFANVLNRQPGELERHLDVDQALWMLAINNVLVNLDSYIGAFAHNYYLYRDTTGIIHPILWDLNLSFGAFRLLSGNHNLSDTEMQELSMFVHYKDQNAKRPLVTQLLSNDLYRKVYVAHCKTVVEDYLSTGLYLQRARELQTLIAKDLKADKNKLYPDETFTQNLDETVTVDETPIVGLAPLMEARKNYLTQHPLFNQPTPTIQAVKGQLIPEGGAFVSAEVDGATKVWLCWRQKKVGPFQRQAMIKGVEPANYYELEIPASKGAEYYLIAEGEKAVQISPQRANKELHILN